MKKLLLLLLFIPFLGIGQIQTQIDSATAGDVINIPAGTYVESLVIDKSISLIASSGAILDVSGHGTGISISQDVIDVTIDGLTIEGDDSTYSGITVSPGATNITLTNNTIRDILMPTGNPSNASPLSYGILCWGNTIPANPPTNITISQNDISNVSGSAISLGTNTESVSIIGNNFDSILPVDYNGQPLSLGIQAELSDDLNINNNIYNNLITSNNLINCTNTLIHSNTYNGSSLMLSTSYPHTVSFYDNPWWSVKTNLLAPPDTTELYYNDPLNQTYLIIVSSGGITNANTDTVIFGCTDSTAINYDSTADFDDGSCLYCQNTTSLSLDTVCDSYTWNETTYTSSGTYTWAGTNATGCDSTATLELIINSNTSAQIYQSGEWLLPEPPPVTQLANWYNTQTINGEIKNWLMASNTPSFKPTFDCYYFITTEDENGCVDTSDVYYFGATANRVGNISTSPNPTNGELTIEFENQKNQTVLFKLLNSKGEILRHYVSTTNSIKTNLKKYPSGIYYLEFDSSKNREGCAGEEKQKTIKKIILNK